MKTMKGKCRECSKEFEMDHGNEKYCTEECGDESRRVREKKKRDPIAHFIAILKRNHERIHELFLRGLKELSPADLDFYGIDISLGRYMQPPPEYEGSLKLDFGYYFFITDISYQTFKIFKHENEQTNESK